MPKRVMRGNDLTGHSVLAYDLKELLNPKSAAEAMEQALRGIGDYAAIIDNFHTAMGVCPEDAEPDSTAALSSEIMRSVAQMREHMTRPSSRNLVIVSAITIGQLHERLRWMWLHSKSARKGQRRDAHETLAQQRGAAANKKKANDAIAAVAAALEAKLGDQLSVLTDAALARQAISLGYRRTERTMRKYIATARHRKLLPRRLEM